MKRRKERKRQTREDGRENEERKGDERKRMNTKRIQEEVNGSKRKANGKIIHRKGKEGVGGERGGCPQGSHSLL